MGLAIQERKLVIKKMPAKKKAVKAALRSVPNIVIIGDKKIRFRLKKFEVMFNLTLFFVELHEAQDFINHNTISVIFDEEKLGSKSKSILKKFVSLHEHMPVFFLSRSKKSSNFYIELYQFGIQGIINWPSEGLILPDLLIESLRVHPKATGLSTGDAKLSKLVKSHIVLLGNYRDIQIKVLDGFLFLNGEVDTLWEKSLIEKECIKILGLKKIISKNLLVKRDSKTTGQLIAKNIKKFITILKNDKYKAIDIKIEDFVVTIISNGSSRNDFISVEEFAMKQPGVQRIKRVVNNHNLNIIEGQKVKLLEKSILSVFSNAKNISIKIFGKNAEISGTVQIPENARLIESYVLHKLPIEKVINKLVLKR